MKRQDFHTFAASQVLLLDGATGTELQKAGMPAGVCPELWCLEHPQAIIGVQRAYCQAGSHIIYTPTFGGNRKKLADFGCAGQARSLNARLARLSRQATEGFHTLVFGDMAPTGCFVEPFGDLPFEEAVDVYREQAQGLLDGGVDGFVIETMMDLQEARAALLAVRDLAPDHPVLVSLTFEQSRRTLTGNSPVSCLVTLQALGADAVGCNCSTGPEDMATIIAEMSPLAKIPLLAKPNAGLPQFRDGKSVYSMQADEFGDKAARLLDAGAGILGGCCGTTPAHIAALKHAVGGRSPLSVACKHPGVVCSAREYRELSATSPFTVIGERINPTGKAELKASLREGRLDLVLDFARSQEKAGAGILDVNLGMSGIDEAAMLRQAVLALANTTALPLCLDTTDPKAAEQALRVYPGRALFNSVSAEAHRLQNILPVAAKYGAMLIILPVTDQGIPDTLEGRVKALQDIIAETAKYGYVPAELCADGLVMAIGSEPTAAKLTLEQIKYTSTELKISSVCGLSNVSHGLPRRDLLNRNFLAMAMANGLRLCIANPSAEGIMETVLAGEALLGHDQYLRRYLERVTPAKAQSAPTAAAKTADDGPEALAAKVYEAILDGRGEAIAACVQAALAAGVAPRELVNGRLIPAITEVGSRYERKEYYLPQLLCSGNAMEQAMSMLTPLLKGDCETQGPKVILATVQGDIHDIGKNIVGLMLGNYGFQVIDLGKDVPKERIVEAAKANDVRIVCLSALMTTTMGRMREVIAYAREQGLEGVDFIVGGAVVDENFAQEIGALYASDAMGTVRLAQRLTGAKN